MKSLLLCSYPKHSVGERYRRVPPERDWRRLTAAAAPRSLLFWLGGYVPRRQVGCRSLLAPPVERVGTAALGRTLRVFLGSIWIIEVIVVLLYRTRTLWPLSISHALKRKTRVSAERRGCCFFLVAPRAVVTHPGCRTYTCGGRVTR